MDKGANTSKTIDENSSFGILNMDNLKVFGEVSNNATLDSSSKVSERFKDERFKGAEKRSQRHDLPKKLDININELINSTQNDSRISERLKEERLKALELLQKTQKPHTVTMGSVNKENNNTMNLLSPRLDRTDYVPFRRPNAFNISELITDESINLEGSSSCPGLSLKDNKISFEPAEITGRSTHISQQKQRSSRLSVSEILASSFAPKARNLCETLNNANIKTGVEKRTAQSSRTYSSIYSSTMNSYNGTQSLPRTADLSKRTECGGTFSFIDNNMRAQSEGNDMDGEFFAPSELMQSKLLMDEINWAKEYAAIPETVLSKQAKAKARILESNEFKSPPLSQTNLLNPSDPNFSIGNFFNMRSDNINNIVNLLSPEKSRRPIALLDDADNTVTTTNSELEPTTPKCDIKKYQNLECGNTVTIKHRGTTTKKQEESSIHNSYMLTLSAIDQALKNMDVHTDDSDAEVVEQLKGYAKLSKSAYKSKYSSECSRASSPSPVRNANSPIDIQSLSENKENFDPLASFSDTISFTESILNASNEVNHKIVRNASLQRSPLSPIEINPVPRPHIKVTLDNESDIEADIDEFPSTPIKQSNRNVRLKKSPLHAKSSTGKNAASPLQKVKNVVTTPLQENSKSELMPSAEAGSVPSPISPTQKSGDSKEPPTHTNKISDQPEKLRSPSRLSPCSPTSTKLQVKSLCSTRLEIAKTLGTECGFISPNLSKTSSVLLSSGTHCGSPAGFSNLSPMSSPQSCGISSQTSSPHLDVTTNAKSRFEEVSKAIGEGYNYNNAACGVPPCPCKSKITASSAARSTSRCSNSSEFSHRDGKVIPLKVTALELSWGSIKLRTDSRKSMQIKNTATKRLVVRIEAQGPGFQIVNDHSNVISLQSQECRSIVVQFCPTVIGVAVGTLSFYSPTGTTTASRNNAPFLVIPLYGYGGNSAILPQNILKGPVGTAFLPIGDLCELSSPVQSVVNIRNRGPLLGFAILCIDSIGLHLPRLCDAFEVTPDRILIPPGGIVSVRIVFRPKREDIKKIMKKITNVLTLVNLRIICGDEANRQRMRSLVKRMPTAELAKISHSNTLEKLWSKFNGEQEMPELQAFKERSEVTFDLLTGMRIFEIAITLNHEAALDETTESPSIIFPDGDETVLFRTVCVSSPEPQQMLERVDEITEASTSDGTWSVEPRHIEFDFNAERRTEKVSLLVRNSYKSRQYFEVVCNYKDLLHFTPSKGYVEAERGQIEVEVHSLHHHPPVPLPTDPIVITVYLENDRIAVPVKVPKDNYELQQ